MYDYALKNGLVIDPSQGIHGVLDVGISEGRIAALDQDLDEADAKNIIDLSGRIVTPGLVDFHVHVYHGVDYHSIEADRFCLQRGVTTVLDAGSAGADTFIGFRKHVVETSRIGIYALVMISSIGLIPRRADPLEDLRFVNVDDTVETIENNQDVILGVKWHHPKTREGYSNYYGMQSLLLAREAADRAHVFLMCEPYGPPLKDILEFLQEGDVLTHVFHGGPRPGILDRNGRLLREVREAIERGVVLDAGHGSAGFSFKVAQKAVEQGVTPTIISSDLWSGNLNGPVFDLPTTLSKFLALGLSLDDTIERATIRPSEAMGLSHTVGTLRVGAKADVAVFQLEEGEFSFTDSMSETRIGKQRLTAISVLKNGNQVKHS